MSVVTRVSVLTMPVHVFLPNSFVGLLWTYRDGKRVDSTFLHVREWLSCIRNGGKPSCGIDEGFDEAIVAHMAGLSYKLGRRIDWDRENEVIVPIEGIDLDEALLADIERLS